MFPIAIVKFLGAIDRPCRQFSRRERSPLDSLNPLPAMVSLTISVQCRPIAIERAIGLILVECDRLFAALVQLSCGLDLTNGCKYWCLKNKSQQFFPYFIFPLLTPD